MRRRGVRVTMVAVMLAGAVGLATACGGSSRPPRKLVGALVAWGHSGVAGGYAGVTPFPTLVGSTLARQVTNFAVDGSQLLTDGPNSWGNILHITSTGRYGRARHQPPPYRPTNEISVLMTGMNDLGCASPKYPGGAQGSAFLNAIGDSLGTVISRLRATAVFPASDRSVAYGPGWKFTPSAGYSGNGFEVTTTPGSTVTIKVPKSFRGGTIDFGTLDAPGYGGTWSFTVDGRSAGSLVTAGVASGGEVIGMVQRFTGLRAGSHTIVATPLAQAGTMFAAGFNYWQIEPAHPEYVGLLMMYDPVSTEAYKTGCGFLPTDADIAAMNRAENSVVKQFDTRRSDRVIPISLPKLNHNASLAYADDLHPNQAGIRYMASQVVRAMARAARSGA
ncbi:MAG TPA: hypothetical protein VG223_09540 [Solirubrobacteraceae bacterium]|nr:hypothetical protein [Solirubrobacteraceae bacterium]